MDKFLTHTGIAAPLKRSAVDTDQIIPAVYLKRVTKTGFEDALFANWRQDPEFLLNQDAYRESTVLIAGPDFGTGSSREHAVWAIQQGGFNAVIAPSFSDIFRNNCGKNGLIVVELAEQVVAKLWSIIETDPQTEITVDVEKLLVEVPSHGLSEKFAMNADTQNRFLNGLDDIAISLKHSDAITAFEKSRPTWFAAKKTN